MVPTQLPILQRLGRSYATILSAVLFFAVVSTLLVLNFRAFSADLGKVNSYLLYFSSLSPDSVGVSCIHTIYCVRSP